jgi:hypothetical protein
MCRDTAVDRAAASQAHRVSVEDVGDRLPDVNLVERRLARVQRDVAAAACGCEEELLLLRGVGSDRSQLGRRRRCVAVHVGRPAEDLSRRHGGVLEPLLEEDLVGVGRPPARLRVPVRVPDEVDQLAGLIADAVDVAGGVGLDHVRTGRHLVQSVVRQGLRVVLPRVLGWHRRGRRQPERADQHALRMLQLEDECCLVRRLDTADGGNVCRHLRRRSHEVAEVGRDVAVRDAAGEATLDRVLHVLRCDRSVDRRAEADAASDVHGHRLAVLRERRHLRREVGHRIHAVGLVGEQRSLGCVGDLVRERVVRLAGVDVVDVAGGQDGDRAALLGASAAGGGTGVAAASGRGKDDACRDPGGRDTLRQAASGCQQAVHVFLLSRAARTGTVRPPFAGRGRRGRRPRRG